jgi:hypothetical protein
MTAMGANRSPPHGAENPLHEPPINRILGSPGTPWRTDFVRNR